MRWKMLWKTNVFGTTLRVVDMDGNDICLVGNCRDPKNLELAKQLAALPMLLQACSEAVRVMRFWPIDGMAEAREALEDALATADGKEYLG